MRGRTSRDRRSSGSGRERRLSRGTGPDPGPLTSTGNPRVRAARRLAERRARDAAGLVLVEGTRLLAAAVEAGVDLETVFAVEPSVATDCGVEPSVVVACDDRVLRHVAATAHPQGVVAVARWRPHADPPAAAAAGDGVLVLDGIADPGNVGTLIRTAAALGCGAVVTTQGSCDVTNPKALRASAGAAFRVAVHADVPADAVLTWCRTAGITGYAAVARGGDTPRRAVGPWALWIGSEAHGLAPERVAAIDRAVTIPVTAAVESLNAAAAGAVLVAACRGVLATD